ncbi:ATP-binding protein [Saccharicrinis sp. FJH62]|uniref:sensor histidine kinase n=1 Tax=Saccharicrinis sp. FJH62 TaxID=3344657 RepID=UPI0035D489A2
MNKEKQNKYFITLLVLSTVFIITGLLSENIYLSPSKKSEVKNKIESHIQSKQAELRNLLNSYRLDLASDSFYVDHFNTLLHQSEKEFYLFGFQNGAMSFWNSNKIIIDTTEVDHLANTVVEFPNSYCMWDSINVGTKTLYGFYPIEFIYRIENRFIKSYFQPELEIPEHSVIYLTNLGKTSSIRGIDNQILCYLDIGPVNTRANIFKIVGLFSFLLFLLFVWGAFLLHIAKIRSKLKRNLLILLSFGIIFLIVAFIGGLEYPVLLNYTELFSPSVFAMPGLFKNLGLILVFGMLWILSALLFKERFAFGKLTHIKNVIFSILMGITFVEIIRLYVNVIEHSVINFQLQLLKDVDMYSLLAYLIFILMFGGWFLIVDAFAKYISCVKDARVYIFSSLAILAGSTVLFTFIRDINLTLPALMAIAIAGASYIIRSRTSGGYNFMNRFVIILLFSILGWIMFWQTQDETDRSKEDTLLGNLAFSVLKERDPITEINLINKTEGIFNDYYIKQMVSGEDIKVDQLQEYLRKFYLNEFWRKYDIQVVLCWPGTDLYVGEDGDNNDCYNYFSGMINEIGEQINESDVYYLDNYNGRVNYFVWIKYNQGQDNEVSLFIDLETRSTSKGIGYPELLSDNNIDLSNLYDDYSFARYVDGKLVNYAGNYQYNTLSDWVKNDTVLQVFNGYIHRFYKTGNNELFVLSKPERSTFDTLLFLVYLFLYLFILTYIAIFFTGLFNQRSKNNRTLAYRIRQNVLLILLLSFMLVGATSIYFNVRQYKNKQLEVLQEKNKSVLVALDGYLGQVSSLNDIDLREFTSLLQNLSNTLYIDINVYDTDGRLAATSRPEVFQREIISRRIDPASYYKLKYDKQPFVLTNESLVGLNYLSAYQPISNWENNFLGYVNLPYFVSSDELSNDVSDFIVVLLNIYLIFVIIAVFLTVLLTREITRPLLLIREKLAGFRLRGANEKIDYHGRDEVAQLVEDYNRLVDELEKSAEQLATSERSMAWRQMARQIAHEIKNPLTPMKLSIQHLQRARTEGDERFNEFFKKTTKTLVEQIDNLSRIASEFSSFSKMPESKPEVVDIIERAGVAVDLFVDTPNVKVSLKNSSQSILVYADREQLKQVFNNLIKNAIQSVPQDRKGIITVTVTEENGFARVQITDNGKGIPEDSRSKLFEPNFTTKSSGMGLGLAITKNIVINSGGDIWFETVENKGTTFFFTLPLFKR